jgi:hypothetical protein
MMWSETRDNHVYVYWRGVLIYKRWVTEDGGYGKVFDKWGWPWMARGERVRPELDDDR